MTIRDEKMANPVTADTMARVVQMSPPALVDYPAGATFGPHTLTDHEFVWLHTGSARWATQGHTIGLRPGDLLLVGPGMSQFYAWDTASTTRHGFVHFTLDRELPGLHLDQAPVRRIGHHGDPLSGLCDYLVWLGRAPWPGTRDRAHQVIELMVSVFVAGPLPDPDPVGPMPQAIEAVATLLRARWADGVLRPVALAEVATAARLSTVQVSRLFRAHLGHPPVTAIELVRLAHAEPLLLRSNLTVAEIGRLCGFVDPYHFSRRFRSAYGVSPRAYRNGDVAAAPTPVSAAGPALGSPLGTFALLTRPTA